jgi:hypothetical protein
VKLGVAMLVDWRTVDDKLLVRPPLYRDPALAPVPTQASSAAGSLSRASLPLKFLKKRYQFFSTPMTSQGPDFADWGAFTFAATDFG